MTILKKILLYPPLYLVWSLSVLIVTFAYWIDYDVTENLLTRLEERWWSRHDHKVKHWTK